MKLKTISLGKYPYTYARVSVMKSLLLKQEDYHKLLKMGMSESISFLQSSQYKKEIDELAVKYSGVELMEMALNRNLVGTWNKLKRISPQEVDLLIDAYLERTDLWNVKTILRGVHTKTSPETTATMLLPAGKISMEKLHELLKAESVAELVKKLKPIGMKIDKVQQEIESYNSKNSIVEIENFIDREYYLRMLEFSKSIPSEGKLFRQFLEAEMESTSIMNILRLKRAGMDRKEIAKYAIGRQTQLIRAVISAESNGAAAKILSQKISDVTSEKFISSGSLSEIEIELGRELLRKTGNLLYQHPLTVDVILGYMFAKEIEVKNLKLLLKARQLDLGNEFVEQQIII